LYSVIREFSPSEKYDTNTGSYIKDDIDKKRAYSFLGIFGLVKAIEITHVLLRKDNINNGEILEETFSFLPDIVIDKNNDINIGAKFIFRI
jgi:hypothetical protein